MEPQIRYARTSDGVSIAYTALGHGPAVIAFGIPGSHLQAEWQVPESRQTYENAAQLSTFIRFDPRGFGLSDRDVSEFSPASMALDLGVPAVIPSRQDCAMLAGGPFLGCAGGPFP
jgi:pimeloyl-ACP methyl ester carboxylesterase